MKLPIIEDTLLTRPERTTTPKNSWTPLNPLDDQITAKPAKTLRSLASRSNPFREAGNAWQPGSQWKGTVRQNAHYAWGITTKSLLRSLLLWISLGVMSCLADPPDRRNAESFAEDNAVMSRHFAIPVALAPGKPASYTISGELFATEGELVAGTTVSCSLPAQPTPMTTGTSEQSTEEGIRMHGMSPLAAFRHLPSMRSVRETAHTRQVTR